MSKLHEQRAAAWAQMTELRSKGAENWSSDDTAKFTKIDAEIVRLTDLIRAEERMAALESGMGNPVPVITSGANSVHNSVIAGSEARGFHRYLTTGDASELRAQSAGVDTAGGFLVPDSFSAEIVKAMSDFGGIRRLAENITTTEGSDIIIPTADETAAEGERLGENTAVSESDLAFGSKTLKGYIYSSKLVRASLIILRDARTNLDEYVGGALGERIGRTQATEWLHGTGSGQPQGLVFGRNTSNDVNTTAALDFDDLTDLIHKVDPAYRRMPGTAFVMNDTVLGAVRKLKGTQNDHPIWEPSMQAGDPDRILGYPVVIDAGMDADAATGGGSHATGVPVLFGNFNKAYIVRDVAGIEVMRLNERYAENLQVGFIGWVRSDGLVKDTKAYAAIERTS